jgi:cytochrome c2
MESPPVTPGASVTAPASGSPTQASTPTAGAAVTVHAPSASPYEEGRELFIAKGCITCHWHARAGMPRSASFQIGPDLTRIESVPYADLPNSETFLRKWLKDPTALRPSTAMPNLGLTDEEIEVLLAFLLAVDG